MRIRPTRGDNGDRALAGGALRAYIVTSIAVAFPAHRGVAQSGSAPALGAGGRRFESVRPDQFRHVGHGFISRRTGLASVGEQVGIDVSKVRIYQPAKTAMQSGRAKSRQWILEFEPGAAQRPDALMGWLGHGDTSGQVRLRFSTEQEAVAYAERAGLDYEVAAPRQRKSRPKTYADNFRFGREGNWTH